MQSTIVSEEGHCMANQEHVYLLKSGITMWNLWRRKQGDVRPDLSGANLCETDLSEANLRKADLRKADLRKALLGKTDFSGADLSEVSCEGVNFSQTLLHNADL